MKKQYHISFPMVLLYIACALTISDFEIVSVVTMLIWISIPALAIYIYDMISGMSRADVKNVLHFYLHNFFIMVSLFLTTYIHVWPPFPWTKKKPGLDFFKSNLSVLYLSGLISQTRKPVLQILTTLFLYYTILENTGWKSLSLIWVEIFNFGWMK